MAPLPAVKLMLALFVVTLLAATLVGAAQTGAAGAVAQMVNVPSVSFDPKPDTDT